jgi:hypothetical protein
MVTTIERRSRLGPKEFLHEYLLKSRPVNVTDAISRWPALMRWTPEYFRSLFGNLTVSLQGNDFHVLRSCKLHEYIDALPQYAEQSAGVVPYLRYSQGDADSFTDAAFARLKDQWERPDFLPSHFYLHPLELRSRPTERRYPGSGIYISARGAITQLHADRGRSHAVLCQVYGTKWCVLCPPAEQPRLPPGKGRRPEPLDSPARAASYGQAQVCEGLLAPGETLFIPAGWPHEIYTCTTSISLTYNFVHFRDAAKWIPYALYDYTVIQSLEKLPPRLRSIAERYFPLT